MCPHGIFDDAAFPGPHPGPHPHPPHRKMLHDGSEDGPMGGREHHPKTLLNQMLHHPPTPPAWDSLPQGGAPLHLADACRMCQVGHYLLSRHGRQMVLSAHTLSVLKLCCMSQQHVFAAVHALLASFTQAC